MADTILSALAYSLRPRPDSEEKVRVAKQRKIDPGINYSAHGARECSAGALGAALPFGARTP
jgi:hypothetical protein